MHAPHATHHPLLTIAAFVVGSGLLLGGGAILRERPVMPERRPTAEVSLGFLYIAFGAFIIVVTLVRLLT